LTRLNHVGAIVFLLTADGLSRGEIIQILTETYGELEGLDSEVARCLDDLIDSGLVFATEDEREFLPVSADQDILAQWLASDKALAEGRKQDADNIYRAIASRKCQTEIDYLYAGLALGRLGMAVEALDRLEAGCRAFPESQPMRENLINIAAANAQIPFLLAWLGADPHEACEQLLALPFCNATIRSGLFDHFLASSELQTARRIAEMAETESDGLLAVWLMADAALHRGFGDEADRLYRQLGEREPISEADYLYIGLAFHRLRQSSRSIEILESGRRAFPNSMSLLKNLVFVCASSGQIALLFSSIYC
jgi:tetratricopeptide (TPR) repeat protein